MQRMSTKIHKHGFPDTYIYLGQNKIYVCLSSPDRPLFLTPDPTSFYGILKTQEGNVTSQCVYKGILSVFTQKMSAFNTLQL